MGIQVLIIDVTTVLQIMIQDIRKTMATGDESYDEGSL